jgi:hypothetical protein
LAETKSGVQMKKPVARKNRLNRRTVLALFAAVVSGCGGQDEELPLEYVVARQRWLSEGIANYRFTLARQCFCVAESPIEVQVRNGVVVSGQFSDSGVSVSAERLATLPTLSGLFDLVDAAYAQNAAAVRFSVHPTYGFLESMFIDLVSSLADEELAYTVSDFVVDE